VKRTSHPSGSRRGDLFLFFGQNHALKNSLCCNTNHSFFGDDCHGWTQTGFTNIEWGCRTPVDGLDKIQDPEIYSATRKFSTLVENAGIDEKRRILLARKNLKYHAIASFPISHLEDADRSGVAEFPKHIFILVKDAMGILPAMGRLTREQATIFLLLGYTSAWSQTQPCEYPTISYLPFYNSDLSIYSGSFYASLFYEKLERSQSECWILNTMPPGPGKSEKAQVDLKLLRQFVSAIQLGSTQQIGWQIDNYWNFDSVCTFASHPETVLDTEKAWAEDTVRLLSLHQHLRSSFTERLRRYEIEMTQPLKDAAELFVG
jgi:phosphoenolpyruvate carboxykinase (ATP)